MGNNVKSILTGYMRFYPWSLFLELATVGGRFFLFKWGLTCCQRGRYFDLLWGSSYKALKTLFPLLKLMRNTIYLFIPRLLNVIKCYFSLNSSPCSSTSLVAGVLRREASGGTSDWEMQYSTVLLLRIPDRSLLESGLSSASEGTGTISSASGAQEPQTVKWNQPWLRILYTCLLDYTDRMMDKCRIQSYGYNCYICNVSYVVS